MIVFDLKCGQEHVFEAWFADSEACESQISGGEVECPMCSDHKVEKAPMAPNIPAGTGKGRGRSTGSAVAKTTQTTAAAIRFHRADPSATATSAQDTPRAASHSNPMLNSAPAANRQSR